MRTFALVEDQSELRSLEDQLVRAEKLITVGVLSAGIAHEIGSPLAVIRGRAEQVLRAHRRRSARRRPADDHQAHRPHLLDDPAGAGLLAPPADRAPAGGARHDRRARAALLQWKSGAKRMVIELALEEDLPLLAADPISYNRCS